MAAKTWLEKKLEQFENDFDFRIESIILDITERICEKLEQKNISRAKFAELLGVSPPAVTKILNGNSNFTLKTLLSIADALELDLKVQFAEKTISSNAETSVYIIPPLSSITAEITVESESQFYSTYSDFKPIDLNSADSGHVVTGGQKWN